MVNGSLGKCVKRVVIPELLDSDAGTPDEIAAALEDLWRINRWFGGVSTSMALVRSVVKRSGKSDLSLLDVAAGSGSLSAALCCRLLQYDVRLSVLLLDRAQSHLSGARNAVVADALAIPLRDRAVDLVASSLFLHHLEPAEIVLFLKEALRVCRVAVLINDLCRSRLHLAAACAGLPLFRSRLTRHDARASIRRAYTISEMVAILQQTRAAQVTIGRHYLFRMGAVVWK